MIFVKSPLTEPTDRVLSPTIFGGDTKVGWIGNVLDVKYTFLIGFMILIGENSVCKIIYLSGVLLMNK